MIVLDHVEDTQILNGDMVIAKSILPGNFEIMVAALPIDLQMRLSNTERGLTATVTTILAPGQLALFAAKRLGARTIYRAMQLDLEEAGLALEISLPGFSAFGNALS